LTGFCLFVTIKSKSLFGFLIATERKGEIIMRRLLYFVGFAAGAFLMWYYLTNLQSQQAQPDSAAKHVPLPSQPPPDSAKETTPQVEAYCVKCKTHRVMQNPYATTTKAGRPAVRGTCPVCGSKMFKMGQM
jgi:hypothetical protein